MITPGKLLPHLNGYRTILKVHKPTYNSGYLKSFYNFYAADADSIRSKLIYLKRLVIDNSQPTKVVDSLVNLINEQLPALLRMNTTELVQSEETWRLPVLLKVH